MTNLCNYWEYIKFPFVVVLVDSQH